jgi:hypothetical protein
MNDKNLSFDGKGINGPDEYRSRLATFQSDEAAKQYGHMFAGAPELRTALYAAVDALADGVGGLQCVCKQSNGQQCWPCRARNAVKRGRQLLMVTR